MKLFINEFLVNVNKFVDSYGLLILLKNPQWKLQFFWSDIFPFSVQTEISQQTIVGFQDVALKTSSIRLQCNNFSSSKTSWRRLEDISHDVLKAFWRRLWRWKIVMLKTSWRRLEDMSWTRPEYMSWKHLQDVLETKEMGISVSHKSKCMCI